MALKPPPSGWSKIFQPTVWYPWFKELWKAVVALQSSSGASVINSIQYGTITIATNATSGTATITSVDTSKAALHFLGFSTSQNEASNQRRTFAYITLTNATTVTATRDNQGSTGTVTVSFCVVEYT